MSNLDSKRILIIAAEASGVLYAERLMEYWQSNKKNYFYFGVGSRKMETLGFNCFGRAEEMAVVGFVEVLKHYSHIKSVFNNICEEIKKNPPSVAVLIDYPGFNLRLAKILHQYKVPVVYYISPQVWAWKQDRVYTIKKYVSKMLVVFPFEEEFYKKFDVPVEFVGHPLMDELSLVSNKDLNNPLEIAKQRARMGIPVSAKVLGLMPGSRDSELDKILPTQIEVVNQLKKNHPNVFVIIMVAPTYSKEQIKDRLEELKIPYLLFKDEPFKMIRLADAVLAASGTATLMVGLLEKPMVIIYKVNFLTAFVGRRIVKGFFGLVNLIFQKEIVPELFQENAVPEKIIPLLEKALFDEPYRSEVIQNLQLLKSKLMFQEQSDVEHLFLNETVTARVAKNIEQFIFESTKDKKS